MRERPVLIKAIQERDNYGKTATAQETAGREAVFRTEHRNSDENPKGRVIILHATIHKRTSCVFSAEVCKIRRFNKAVRLYSDSAVLSF